MSDEIRLAAGSELAERPRDPAAAHRRLREERGRWLVAHEHHSFAGTT
ncbi:hypothetical protein ACWD0A_07615 [Streptomyces sp. NPDC002867]